MKSIKTNNSEYIDKLQKLQIIFCKNSDIIQKRKRYLESYFNLNNFPDIRLKLRKEYRLSDIDFIQMHKLIQSKNTDYKSIFDNSIIILSRLLTGKNEDQFTKVKNQIQEYIRK